MAATLDAGFPRTATGTAGTATVPSFTAGGGKLLVALVTGVQGTGDVTETVTGTATTWTLLRRTRSAPAEPGAASIWVCTPASDATGTVTVAGAGGGTSITILQYTGGEIGVHNGATGTTNAPSVALAAAAADSLALGVGFYWPNNANVTPGAGQTELLEFDSSTGDTHWSQRLTSPTGAAGTITVGSTLSAAGTWAMSAVEVRAVAPPSTAITIAATTGATAALSLGQPGIHIAATTSASAALSVTPAAPPTRNAIRFPDQHGAGLTVNACPDDELNSFAIWARVFATREDRQMSPFSLEDLAANQAGGTHDVQMFETRITAIGGTPSQFEVHSDTDPGGNGGILFSDNIGAGVWVFLAQTHNRVAGRTTFYWRRMGDASLSSSQTTSTFHPAMPQLARTLVGTMDCAGQQESFNGDVTLVKTWDAELSAAEVLAESQQGWPVRTANLRQFYPLQSLSDLNDYSGNGHHLSPIGAGTRTLVTDGPQIPLGEPQTVAIAATTGATAALVVSQSAVVAVAASTSATAALAVSQAAAVAIAAQTSASAALAVTPVARVDVAATTSASAALSVTPAAPANPTVDIAATTSASAALSVRPAVALALAATTSAAAALSVTPAAAPTDTAVAIAATTAASAALSVTPTPAPYVLTPPVARGASRAAIPPNRTSVRVPTPKV